MSRTGLREKKKQATREALREAALRLAIEHGPENVRVDDIAAGAGVSPRTYNNYFSSREHAIVAAITAEREAGVAAVVAAQPPGARLAVAVTEAVVAQYAGRPGRDVLRLLTSGSALRQAFIGAAAGMEEPLATAIAARISDDEATARILAASVAAAVRIGIERWLQPTATGGLVVVSGSLPDHLRAALEPLAPALDAAGGAP